MEMKMTRAESIKINLPANSRQMQAKLDNLESIILLFKFD
jgi:hypothetical protein